MPHGGRLTLGKAHRLCPSSGRAYRRGIPNENLERVFEPSFTTKAPGKGTCLGLSAARAIVRSRGGFIDLHSELGKGTSFKVLIPALVQKDLEGTEMVRDALPVGQGELVLIVDEAAVRESAKQVLGASWHRTLMAADGRKGMAVLAEYGKEVRALLVDMNMPDMNGAEMITCARNLYPHVRTIATSGFTGPAEGGSRQSEAGDATPSKPYSADALLRTLSQLLSGLLPPHA